MKVGKKIIKREKRRWEKPKVTILNVRKTATGFSPGGGEDISYFSNN